MHDIAVQGLLALIATIGFCTIFRVPAKLIPVAGLIGALSWALYQIYMAFGGNNSIIATFLAAALVGLLSDICARIMKEAATIFIIPGILPLVPGSYIFYTMQALLDDDVALTGTYAASTIKLAAAIALGLLSVGSVTHVITAIITKTVRHTKKVTQKVTSKVNHINK